MYITQSSQEVEVFTPGHFSITQYKAAIENLNVQMGVKTVELGKIRSKLSETEQTLSNRDKEVRGFIYSLSTCFVIMKY